MLKFPQDSKKKSSVKFNECQEQRQELEKRQSCRLHIRYNKPFRGATVKRLFQPETAINNPIALRANSAGNHSHFNPIRSHTWF